MGEAVVRGVDMGYKSYSDDLISSSFAINLAARYQKLKYKNKYSSSFNKVQ